MNAMPSDSQPPTTSREKIYGYIHAANITSVGGNTVSISTRSAVGTLTILRILLPSPRVVYTYLRL